MDDPIKLCKDCSFYLAPSCRFPQNMRVDPVNGGIGPYNSPAYLRETPTKCGPGAQWFVPLKVEA